jgi:probable HAF family extracellular repeat protein
MTTYRTFECIIVLSAFALSVTGAHAAQYIVTDLGVAGAENTLGWGINAAGQVTGYAGTPGEDAVTGFVWNPTTPNGPTGALHRLDTLGGYFAWGIGINASGQVSGLAATADDEAEHATLWIPTIPNGSTGTLHDLGTLGGSYSQASGINDSGQLTGYSDLPGDEESHAIVWKPTTPGSASGAMHDLGTLGGTFSFGWDISASGSVTGDSDTLDDEASHAFLWKPAVANGASGVMHDLGTLGGTDSGGSGMNSAGQISGWSKVTGDGADHAFLWTPTTLVGVVGDMLDLGTLDGSDSYGYAVNNHGHVVGLSYVPPEVSNNSHAFLYTAAGGIVDLNDLIDPLSGWELLDASELNDAGQITGQGLIGDEYHAYLLTPVSLIPGDFNGDSSVDAADLASWKAGFGTSGDATLSQGDADADLDVDGMDLLVWQRHLGSSIPAIASSAPVPEPSSTTPFILGYAMAAHLKRAGRLRKKSS